MKINTRTMQRFVAVFLIAMITGGLKAQLSGAYSVPASYTSIAAVINDLNTVGVSGAVTINVSAGYTETAVSGGYTLNSIPGASSSNSVVFQKTSGGANPVVFAYTGGTAVPSSAAQDGVWRFVGTDFVTIDGIDINDPNTSNPATMEFGYGFFKASVGDGCSNNTIKNCTITLNAVNNAAGSGPAVDGSRGIDMVNATVGAHITALTPTSSAGANSNNRFYGNVIQNCNIGISIIGFAAATPFTTADTGNDVGGNAISTGNMIVNYGGGGTTSPAAAVRTLAQYNINVSYNTINNNNGAGVSHGAVLRGVYLNTATSANATINNNTITLSGAGTTSQLSPIENASGSTAANNTITINNNLIANCTYSTATSGVFYGIFSSASASVLNVCNNIFANNTTSATSGSYYTIYNSGAVTALITFTNNLIGLGTFSASSTSLNLAGIYNSSGSTTTTLSALSNTFQGGNFIGATGGTGTGYMIYNNTAQAVTAMNNNIFNNVSLKLSGTFYFMYNSNATPNTFCNNNVVVTGFNKTVAGGTVYGYYNFGSPGSGTATFNNNNISNITLTGATTFYGLYQATSTSQLEIFNSNIISNVNTGASTIYGLYHNYGASGSSVTNNTVTGLYGGSTIFGINLGNSSASASVTVSGNVLNTYSTSGSAGPYGIYQVAATVSNIFKNKIYDLSTNNTTGVVWGIYVGSGTTSNIYNNIVGDLRAPASASATAIAGIYINTPTTAKLYYNTVYLNATSSSTVFGTSAIYASTTASLELRNNLFNNNSAAVAPGLTAAYRRSSTTLGTFLNTSNNNLFYGGVPTSSNVIFTDGTTSYSTIASYKAAMITRDANAVTELTTFSSTTGSSAAYLHVNNTITTLVESGAVNVAGITDDFDGQIRAGNAGYTGTGSAPDIGADEFDYNLPACSTASAGTVSIASPTACSGNSVQMSSTGFNVAGGLTYQWKVSSTSNGPYTNVSGGSGANSPGYLSAGLSSGTFYYVMVATCSVNSTTNTSNQVTITVSQTPSAAIVVASNTVCSGVNLNLGGSTNVGTTFAWAGPNSFTSAVQNPSISNVSTSAAGVYTLIISTSNCTASPVTQAITVLTTPTSLTVTPLSASLCAGSSQTLTATGGVVPVTLNVGTNINQNVYNSYPSPYSVYYGGQRSQFMILASELSAAGFLANTPINSINLPVASLGTNWGSVVFDVQGFKIGIGGTSLTSLTAFNTTLTTVVGPINYTPSVGYSNVHVFSTPYIWNGTDNVVIETAFSNNITGVQNDAVFTYTTPTSFASSIVYRADGIAAATMYTTTTVSTSFNGRPDFKLNGQVVGNFNWSPSLDLSAATGTQVISTPTVSRIYTVNVANGVCSATAAIPIGVASIPSLNLVSTSTLLCGGTSATLTASGSTSYTWSNGATTSSIVVSPSSNINYSVLGTSAPCPGSASSSVNINASPSPTVTISGSSGICTGQNATLTAGGSGATSYSWSNGSTSNSIVTAPTSNTTYTLTGSNAGGCSTSTTQLVTVAASLSITITGPSTVCSGQTPTLSAGGGVTYTWNTSAQTSTISPTLTSNTTFSVIGASGTCSNSAAVTITVNANPTVSIAGNNTICAGQAATLTASGASTYSWNTTATTASVSVSPLVNTTYTVKGTSAQGCSVNATQTVVSNPLPVISVAQSASSVCVNSTGTFTASGAVTYTWSSSSNNSTISITPTASAVYTVSGSTALGCVSSKTFALGAYPLPTVAIAPSSATVCSLSQVFFSASGANSYTWNNGSITTQTVNFSPSTNTVYTLVGTSTAGCVSSATVGVTTNSIPVVSIAPASMTICAFSPATFTASGASTYTWNNTTASSTVTLFQSSNTTHTVVGMSAQGCSASATVAVVTNPLPSLTLTPTFTTVCANSTFTAGVTGAITYSWVTGSTLATTAITPSVSSTFSVVGTDALGCSSSAQVIVVTSTLPVLGISPATATVCAMSPVSFTASGAASYTWNSNGPNTASVTLTPSGNTVYTVSGTDANNGCVGNLTVAVTTNSLPVLGIAASASTVCPGSSANLTASGANTFTWLVSNATGGATVAVTPTTATVYTVTGTNGIGCVGTNTFMLGMFPAPNIVATPAAQTICLHETATVTASGGNTYTWSVPANGSVFTASPSLLTQYSVTGTDANNCEGMATFLVHVSQCLGINNNGSLSSLVTVFPNPSAGAITAKFEFEGVKNIEIVNAIGQVIEERATEGTTENFNLAEYAKGIYYVKVSSKQASGNFRIVIQ